MRKTQTTDWRRAAALALVFALGGCAGEDAEHAADGHGGEHAEAEARKGPHGGRLLADGDFALELAIFGRGVPPEFRAWAYEDQQPLAPAEVQLEVELRRFGNRIERIRFAPAGDFLRGDATVAEPHSFAVTLRATRDGRRHDFEYESYEARVQLDPAAARESGIEVDAAGPARIRQLLTLPGRIEPDGDHTAHVTPRFPGVVLEARKRLGDAVAKDEVVAVVESNESLRPYEVRSRIAGTAIEKSAVPGEFVGVDATVYVVSDLNRVWADLRVHRRDFERLRLGQRVWIDAGDGAEPAEAKIDYLSPLGSADSQTLLARAVVANAGGRFRPGLFVSARVEIDAVEAPVAVRTSALQRLRAWDVVFLADGDTYEAQPVELGLGDGEWTEIRSGLVAGQAYVGGGSFVLKADVGKSGASHDH
jgi:cobalt-zinc-cadmium efflux system membrane fusion protein